MSNINKQALTDEAIRKAFAGTNFGRDDFKNILAETVIDAAAGWRCGYTATTICTQLGLLTPKGCASALGLRFISEHVQRETKRLKDELEEKDKRLNEILTPNMLLPVIDDMDEDNLRHVIKTVCENYSLLHAKWEAAEKRIAELERERDLMQAAALAMRDDMRDAREANDANTAELVAAGIITKVGE
ncbi:hypothetical protein [Leclercia adecarboxylata]|uniref:hypothetical protein n=1 Tax=Leclercia adecarboxylata TaxID=83655 RepID=UPI0022E35B8F|nr:hypothetical protein [Leclercia adecarboxylata]